MRYYCIFLLFIAYFSGCQQNTRENSNLSSNSNVDSNAKTGLQIKAQKEREDTFVTFQKYVDIHYSKWKVKGVSKEEYNYSERGEINLNYVLLIADNSDNKIAKKDEKIITIITATFELVDGTIETHLFEPTQQTVKRLQARKQKERNIEQGKEDMMEDLKQQSFESSYDAVNDR